MNTLHTIYREPFSVGAPLILEGAPGRNLAEIAASVLSIPADFFDSGAIAVNGEIVSREHWLHVRPKANTVVTIHAPIRGGQGGGGKQVFALVAAIALSVATAGIAGGALAPVLGGSFAAGTLGASLLAGAVGIGGALAISALSSPPVVNPNQEADASGGNRLEPAAISGNILQPNTPIPRVIGTRKVFPPFASEPIIELIGQDEFVEAVYVLGGPHDLSDVRLGDGSVDESVENVADVEIELRDGLPTDEPLTLTTRQGRTLDANQELSVHQVNPEDQDNVDDTVDNPLPVFHAFTTRTAPDENWMQLLLSGLARQADNTDDLRIAFRIRMRRRGDVSWRDLPELHYMNATTSQVRTQIKIFWGNAFTDAFPTAPSAVGWVAAYKTVPAQDVAPLGTEFTADSYFSAGAGNDVYENGTELTTNVQNVVIFANRVEVYLDETEWTPGIYDIEIKRSAPFRDTLFTSSTYDYNGDTLDFFGQIDTGVLPITRAGLLDRLVMTRLVNIWNEYPIKQSNTALISLKARNRSVNRLSCTAKGLVNCQPLGRGPLFEKQTGNANYLWTWDDAATIEDVEVLALIRPEAYNTTSPQSIGVTVRGQGTSPTESLYTASLYRSTDGATDRFALQAISSGTFTILKDVAFKWEQSKNYWIRLRAVDTTIQAKVWPASLPEPEDWSIEVTDSSVSGAGWVGLFGFYLEEQNYCNWFSVGSNGDSAPSAPDIYPTLATDFSEYTLAVDLSDWTSRLDANTTSVVTESDDLPYNGEQTGWTDFRATRNPAPHFRDVLTGPLNFDPLPLEIFDDAGVSDWRVRCAASDFRCDMVVEGLEVSDLLRVVSSTGYARLYRSELWGVTQDKSRAGESPVQIFSPRNSNSFSWQKAFPRLPAGFRINYKDEDDEFSDDQITVYRQGIDGSGQRLEQQTYDGIVAKNDVIRRATFDLRQASDRSTFYSFTAPAEVIVCRRGSLIGVNHDVLSRQYGYARIEDVEYDNNQVVGLILDSPITVKNEPDVLLTPDFLDVDDVLDLGLQTAIAIRDDSNKVTTHALSTPSGEASEIEFETPVTSYTIGKSNLVVAGLRDNEYRRLIVSEITPNPDLGAQLVCVDEASEIFTEIFNGDVGTDFIAKAVEFDGTNDYLTRGAGLTGAADSKLLTFSVWIYIQTVGGRIFCSSDAAAGSNQRTRIGINGSGDFFVVGTNSGNTTILDIDTDPLNLNQWYHVTGSFDLSDTNKRHLYVDDSDSLNSINTYTDDVIDFTKGDWAVGAIPDGTQKYDGYLAELWYAPGVYLDLSKESNRRKFISSAGKPVDLSADGSTPLGYSPLVFLSGYFGTWHTNKGTGGGFTESGTITEAPSAP